MSPLLDLYCDLLEVTWPLGLDLNQLQYGHIYFKYILLLYFYFTLVFGSEYFFHCW